MSKLLAQQHYHNGLQHYRAGDAAQAEAEFRNALRLERGVPLYWKSLALALFEQKQFELADKALRKSLRMLPRDRGAYVLLYTIAESSGQWDSVQSSLQQGAELFPKDPYFPFHIGKVLFAAGDSATALAYFQAARKLCPDDLLALEFIKNCFARIHGSEKGAREFLTLACGEHQDWTQLQAACAFAADYIAPEDVLRAIRNLPEHPRLRPILLNLLQKTGQLRSALQLSRVLMLEQDFLPTRCIEHYRLCCQLGEFSEARDCIERILAAPDRIDRAFGANLLTVNCCPYLSPEQIFQLHQATVAKLLPKSAQPVGEGKPGLTTVATNAARSAKGKLRIGFISGDFRRHSVGYFALPVVAHLRALGHEVFLYHTSPATDDFTQRFQASCHRFTFSYLEEDEKMAEHIRRDHLDVLLDLSGHTMDNRLPIFAFRVAPLQATWLGYSTTTAMPEMDIWISDSVLSPEQGRELATERIVRLPRPWLAYHPYKEVAPAQPKVSGLWSAPVFGCINTLQKLSESSIRLYSRLLQECPDASLLIKNKEVDCAETRAGLTRAFAGFGIAPERLQFRGYQQDFAQHAATLHSIDLTLDTTPYSGATTTCDTLWLGLPVLTLTGELFISRMSTSILQGCGLPEWCATSEDEFVAKAIEFASDRESLNTFRTSIRAKMQASPLMDTLGLTKALLNALS